ncbi:sulfatase [Algoriphagus sp. H41]|uniref:Sulfatase n=1 Tax=Algoriphagus oliviformis TaxID=2811231 RepID=A0ABS3C4H4_9BACT|nr:sulfatase [Algoriphagus oliviformis]MBN7811847.1 sulfatase [Algoriphagus oliviformis]
MHCYKRFRRSASGGARLGRFSYLWLLTLLWLPLELDAQSKRPNILFILTDDQRWDALGFAGNGMIHTPEMDRLASEGTYFENAFVTTPICAASRASILTGMYERTHGYTFGQGEIKAPYIGLSYPALLKGSGYYTGFFGKFGVSYSGFDGLFDVGESYDRNGAFKDRRGYFFKTIGSDTVHLTRYTGQQAIDFIQEAPEDRPFVLSLSFSAPHAHDPAEAQYFWSPEFDSLYRDLVVPDPMLAEDSYFQAQPEYVRTGENRTRWHWRYDTPEKYQHSVKGYFRMISEVDAEIGKIRKALEEKGLADNTVIILMGDNGYFLGERQLAGKWLMYDNSLRVPLIIHDPRKRGARRVEGMALNVDIASTIFDLAGMDIPKEWQGRSLVTEVEGVSSLEERTAFVAEHLWEVDIIAPSEGLRTKDWKYFRYRNDPDHEELYHLAEDPYELTNLAGDARYREKLADMRSKFDSLAKDLESKRLD